MTRTTLRHTWVLGIALAVIGFIFMAASGVAINQAVVLTVIVGLQIGAGVWFWSLVRSGNTTAVEAVGMGSAIGIIGALLFSLLTQALGLGHWGWVLLPVATLITWLMRRTRRTSAATENVSPSFDRATLLALIVTAVVGLLSLIPNIASYPLSWAGTGGKYHADMLFFEALSSSLTKFGSHGSIFSPGDSIHYHWLAYAWTGQITNAASADPFVALTRVLPFIAIASSCLIAIAWVKRLTNVVWAPSLAVLLLILGGYVGATYGAIFNFDSPSQSITAAWILAFSYAFVLLLKQDTKTTISRVGQYIVVILLMFGLAGGKISAGVIALAAMLFTTLIALMRKEARAKSAVLCAALATGTFIATYLLIVSGSADPGGLKFLSILDRASSVQGLNPIAGSLGIVLGTLILGLAIIARWSGIAWFWANPQTRWTPSVVFGSGLAIGGIIALLALSSGLNETWFALAASAPLAAISAAGAGEAAKAVGVSSFKKSRMLIVLVICAAILFAGVAALWMTGASGGNVWHGTLRWLAPVAGVLGAVVIAFVIAKVTQPKGLVRKATFAFSIVVLVVLSAPSRLIGFGSGQVGTQPGLSAEAFGPIIPFLQSIDPSSMATWSDQHVTAAQWLKVHNTNDELVATNITLGAFVPALTQLPTYASALGYQGIYGPPDMVQPLIDREAQSWAFINGPTAQTAKPLCDSGVKWLWVDPTRTGTRQWAPFANIAYSNEAATILQLNVRACAAR